MSTIEIIPDEDKLFCRVHKNLINTEGDILPRAFDPTPYPPEIPDGLSVNWSKYSSAQETQVQVKANNKNPQDYAVVSFTAGAVRGIGSVGVTHDPKEDNLAHSLITGIPPRKSSDTRIIRELQKQAQQSWEINI